MEPTPPIYDYVMASLRATAQTQRQIAAGSGVPFSTVCKIAQRYIKAPSVHSIQQLSDYFRRIDSASSCTSGRPLPNVVSRQRSA